MDENSATNPPTRRWPRLLKIGCAVAIGFLLMLMGPDLLNGGWSYVRVAIPNKVGIFLEKSRVLWITLLVASSARIWMVRRGETSNVARLAERVAGLVLSIGLPTFVGLAALAMFLTWLPHSLLWPWWADVEHFSLSALSWERGVSPYRDLHDFNFPAPMYLHWLLGKLFGWGRTTPFYILEAIQLVVFSIVMVFWSRARFGASLPGLVVVVLVLSYHCNLPFWLAAQRDWRVPLLMVVGLALLEGWPGRPIRVLSAVIFAVAFAFRPHAVIFAPAYLSALDENARRPGESLGRTARASLEWVLVAASTTALMFLPLVVTGTLDDFQLNFQEALEGGGYEATGRRSFAADLFGQLNAWEPIATLLGVVAMALFATTALRRTARTWLLALVFVLFYLPLSPVAHAYLHHPHKVISCVAIGVMTAGLIGSARLCSIVKAMGVIALLVQLIPGIPLHCRPGRTLESALYLWRGETPHFAPPGCEREYSRAQSHLYQWNEYQRLLEYLRRNTSPRTTVANFLRSDPFPTVNAPVARLTPFPSVAGILWLRWVDSSLEPEFARRLERPGDGVVVWIPNESPGNERLRLPLIEQTIRRYHALEARIGDFEVWRRRADVPAGTVDAPRDSLKREDP